MKNIIPYDKNYRFVFLEEKIKENSPVSNYFLKLNDISINLLINLKWILWAYEFLINISKEVKKIDKEDFLDKYIMEKLNLEKNKIHEILIDNIRINDENDLIKIFNEEYNNILFNENTIVHMKLKINIEEFLIISNYLYPELIIFKNNI